MKKPKPIVVAAIAMLLLGTLFAQASYWARVGDDGIRFQENEEISLNAEDAKVECKKYKQMYTSSKDYNIENVYEVTVRRGTFPFTYREKCLIEGPLFRWSN